MKLHIQTDLRFVLLTKLSAGEDHVKENFP